MPARSAPCKLCSVPHKLCTGERPSNMHSAAPVGPLTPAPPTPDMLPSDSSSHATASSEGQPLTANPDRHLAARASVSESPSAAPAAGRSARLFGRLGKWAAVLACSALWSCDGPPETQRPDVIVVVIDTLRADHLPWHGYPKLTAPYLNELAQKGVVFDRAWSASSWTAPSTASIFTGVYPNQHGVTAGLKLVLNHNRENQDQTIELNRIPDSLETLPLFFRDLGYRTYGLTDNPNIQAAEGFDRGFDRFKNFDYKNARHMNVELGKWAQEIRASEEPTFTYLHYMDPHFPYVKREAFYQAPADPGDPVAELKAVYDSEIGFLDALLRKALESIGFDEHTILVVTADHGEELMQRGDLQHNFKLYSELIHVPLFIVQPGIEPKRKRVQQNVSTLDILPSLREMLAISPSRQDQGRSLLPYYLESEQPEGRVIFSMRSRLEELGGEKKRAVILGKHKLILTQSKRREFLELYDLEQDPKELNNLAESQPEFAAELRERWLQFEAGASSWKGERVRIDVDEEMESSLTNLGYFDEKPDSDSEETEKELQEQ